MAAAIGAALMVAPIAANAAGMGKITVLSALGQPLRAELDITASREELASLAARVAPMEAFRQANVEYASVLSTVRFTLDKHADGKPYFRIQTDRAVNDPFIDFLVELSWSSGRLVREYAFLLDPLELKADGSPAAVNEPVAQPPASAVAPAATGEQMEVPPSSATKRNAAAPSAAKIPKTAASASPGAAEGMENTRKVKAGDTLGKIAAETAVEGVTLDQMLVALFNSNRDAFDGGNMNRLRAGKILTIPEPGKLTEVGAKEAHKVVVAQSADFNAYRNSLATAAATQQPVEQQAQQASSGKITPKVEEKTTAASGQDKLQVSRSEADAKSGKGKVGEEDIVARDKALKEANSRIAALEKNLVDLQKLAELKGEAAADAQKPAKSNAPASASTTVVAPPAKVADGDKGLAVTTPPTPVTTTTPNSDSAAAAATPADEKPKPKPKKKIVPPPPAPEPSFIEDNPLLVFGGGAALAALLGFFGFRAWKRKRDDAKSEDFTVSDLAASSVFGTTAGQSAGNPSVDTDTAAKADFSQTIIDEIDAGKESVDPIQEAEVYMAYGRDGQAEEILLDARRKDPGNLPVLLKLLEIYAGRKSVPQFNEVASDLHQRSGGAGAEWERAAAMGRPLDPGNSLYGGSSSAEPERTVSPEPSMASTMIMNAPPLQEAPQQPEATAAAIEEAPNEEVPSVLDFDLDLGTASAPDEPSTAAVEQPGAAVDLDFDLDLGGNDTDVGTTTTDLDINFDTPAPAAEAGSTIDFDIAASADPIETGNTPTASVTESPLDFDFDLGDVGDANPAVADEPMAPPLDLSSISLNLDEPAAPAASGDVSEAATKLELAQAYEEMGDREGARELLQEVLAEGSPAQQEAARSKLDQLG